MAPAWILKAPRVVLVIVFPVINLILYLILSLGCINDSVSGISPVIARSPGPVTLGGQAIQVDIRVGFFGVCFGPTPFNCTTTPSKRPSQLASDIPPSKGGGNFALAGLALGLQSSFIVLSGIPLLLLLIASLVANIAQLYFNTNTRRRDLHAQAALWARSLDWAAAAGAVTSFAAYQAIVGGASRLVGTIAGVPLAVSVGTTASNLFAAVVGLAVGGAVVNTALAAMDAGFEAYLAGKRGDGGGGGGGGILGQGMEMGRMMAGRKRAAYERFP